MNRNKVLVQVCLPVTEKSYDILIPRTISVRQAACLISSFFTGMTGGAYMPGEDSILCSMEDGKIYCLNSSVEDLHLKNGSKLMLI